jgi:hypothetical protein
MLVEWKIGDVHERVLLHQVVACVVDQSVDARFIFGDLFEFRNQAIDRSFFASADPRIVGLIAPCIPAAQMCSENSSSKG